MDESRLDQTIDHIKKNTKLEKGKRFTTKQDYFDIGQNVFGIPKDQITAVSDFHNTLADAGTRVTADDLASEAEAVLKSGGEIKDMKSETRIPIHGGRFIAEVFAERRHNNPRPPYDKIISRGSSKVSLRMNSAITTSAATYARERIEALTK